MTYELAVSTEMMFREHGTPMSLERLTAIASAGIGKVEFWQWRNKDLSQMERALGETGLSVVSMVAQPRSGPIDPDRRDEFIDAVKDSIPIAARLGIPNLVLVAGDRIDSRTDVEHRESLTSALQAVAPYAEDARIVLALENLNSRIDHVGTYLDRTPLALDIIRDVGSPNVRMLYDLYHSVVMGEDPKDVLSDEAELIAHVQIADHPGRHEPGTGTVDWKEIVEDLRTVGYRGSLGLECTPSTGDSAASLQYIREVLAVRAAG